MPAKKPKLVPETPGGRIFGQFDTESYPHKFKARLELKTLVGGTPTDQQVATGWLKSKLLLPDDRIREMVAETMAERGVSMEEATQIVNDLKNLNGFKRTRDGQLYIEGRQVKAAMKEAVSVAVAAKKLDMTGWGATRKWLTTYFPEHVFVVETTIPVWRWDPDRENLLPVAEPSETLQQFVHTHRGSSISYQEMIKDAVVEFTVITDHPFKDKDWAMLWTTGEYQGLGASRSQGYGVYGVTMWDRLTAPVAGDSEADEE